MPKAPQPLEKVIQKHIMEYLTLRGWVVERMNSGVLPVNYGGKTRRIRMHTAGTPDILALRKEESGHTAVLFVEVKRPGEVPTEIQNAKHAELREKTGARVIVATSWEDVETALSPGGAGESTASLAR